MILLFPYVDLEMFVIPGGPGPIEAYLLAWHLDLVMLFICLDNNEVNTRLTFKLQCSINITLFVL